ncbi:MBL fold metallo-hydrolase [Fodinicurvata sp. EGI_FJ10296]|uniref:MBL fold metallo-hydrolase n=1 Tax=Fodinicurvata sp. EGI_FJ10296 TaxID=3231908 RepID=UPI003456E8E1
MELTLLGTGCPVVSTTRYGPAQLVRHAGRSLLIDCGSGVTQRLVAAGCPGRDLDAIVLTHLHSDHLVDLYQLIISSWHQGRERPQRIFGPAGTRAHVEGLMALWAPERQLRITHEQRPSTAALDIEVTEIDADWTMHWATDWATDWDSLTVSAIPVDHRPVSPAFGFAFAADDRRIVFSGDTRPCAALEKAASGADLLLHEVFVHREMPVIEGVRSAETVASVAGYHTLSTQVGELAARAGVGCLALTHFVPPGCDREALLAEIGADFTGPIIIGEDLMTFDLHRRMLCYGNARLTLPLADTVRP